MNKIPSLSVCIATFDHTLTDIIGGKAQKLVNSFVDKKFKPVPREKDPSRIEKMTLEKMHSFAKNIAKFSPFGPAPIQYFSADLFSNAQRVSQALGKDPIQANKDTIAKKIAEIGREKLGNTDNFQDDALVWQGNSFAKSVAEILNQRKAVYPSRSELAVNAIKGGTKGAVSWGLRGLIFFGLPLMPTIPYLTDYGRMIGVGLVVGGVGIGYLTKSIKLEPSYGLAFTSLLLMKMYTPEFALNAITFLPRTVMALGWDPYTYVNFAALLCYVACLNPQMQKDYEKSMSIRVDADVKLTTSEKNAIIEKGKVAFDRTAVDDQQKVQNFTEELKKLSIAKTLEKKALPTRGILKSSNAPESNQNTSSSKGFGWMVAPFSNLFSKFKSNAEEQTELTNKSIEQEIKKLIKERGSYGKEKKEYWELDLKINQKRVQFYTSQKNRDQIKTYQQRVSTAQSTLETFKKTETKADVEIESDEEDTVPVSPKKTAKPVKKVTIDVKKPAWRVIELDDSDEEKTPVD